MKKIIKKIAAFMLAVLIAAPAVTMNADAASSVTVKGGDNVKGGEVFTVTVTFNGDSIGRVVGDVTYDTEMLSYISGGSSSGNVGYIELKKAGTGEALTFNLKFQALKEGSTNLEVSTSEMYDLGEMFMDTPAASKSVTITGNAASDEIIEETTEADDQAADEAQGVDEKDAASGSVTEPSEEAAEDTVDSSNFLGKAIMFGIIGLILILIIVMLLRRKK